MQVVGCILEQGGKFVLPHRHAHKPEGNTWGLPSGKVEAGETPLEAITRELFEETGHKASSDDFELLGSHDFISSSGSPYNYITYRLELDKPHQIVLEDAAHSEYKWVSIDEANAMDDLISSLHGLFRLLKLVG